MKHNPQSFTQCLLIKRCYKMANMELGLLLTPLRNEQRSTPLVREDLL